MMPIVTPYEMRLRRDMQEHLPQVVDFRVVIHGERYEVYFRFQDEPEDDGFPHSIKGNMKQVQAGIVAYAEELAALHEESADVPTGTT